MSQSGEQRDETPQTPEAAETAESGAPAEGRAVRDRFSTDEIFQRIVATAEDEFSRSSGLLFLSGLAAFVLARAGLLSSDATTVAMERGTHMLSFGFETLLWKAVFAGWLVATLVWLAHAMRESAGRILMLWVIVFTIGVAELAHCIVGACEVLFVVFTAGATVTDFLTGFLVPTVVGNTIGGVLLVAILNYGQIAGHTFIPGREWRKERLSTREWLFGLR